MFDRIKFFFKFFIMHRSSINVVSVMLDIFLLLVVSFLSLFGSVSQIILLILACFGLFDLIWSFSRFCVFASIYYYLCKGGDSLSEYLKRNI